MLLRPHLFQDLPGVAAGFTTRVGGVSAAPFGSLNLGLSTDDDPAAVQENRRRMAEALGFDADRLAIAGQVHGNDVLEVTAPGLFPGYDALVTTTPGLLLCISAADCAAVLLADAERGVLGAAHSGWRGTVARVVPRTVAAMVRLGARPDHLRAYIGPCISVENFEVGPEVAAHFDDAFVHQPPGQEKPHVDLKGTLRAHLREAGVPDAAVEVSDACTYGDTQRFFSYRAEDGATGRMMGVIGLKPSLS